MKFKKYTLSDLCHIQRGASPRPIKDFIVEKGIPWVKIADATVDSSRYLWKTKEFIKQEGVAKSRQVFSGDLILSNSATPGLPKIMKVNACIHDGWLLLSNFEKTFKEFVYYLLINERRRLVHQATGSVFNNLKIDTVRNHEVAIPSSIIDQEKIVSVLESIDDKIELNSSIISNLEQLAQTLFKHWFIDFEFPNEDGKPYKSSGGKMIESELGMIPEQWEIGTLNDLGKIVGGSTPSKKIEEYYTEVGYSWLTPKDLSNDKSIYQYKGAIDITEEALNKSSAKLYPENTVLFSSRAPIGYIAIAGQSVSTNQGFKSIIPDEKFPSVYIYCLLKYLTPVIKANAGGSTFKEISARGMKGIKSIMPTQSVLEKFASAVNAVFEGIKIKEKENKSLSELRDTLLPKLLSGEIELPDNLEVNDNVSIS